MKRQFVQGCALLLAMFYLVFAGGIELLHHHTDGVSRGQASSPEARAALSCPAASSSPASSSHEDLLQKKIRIQKTHASDCVACQWTQNGRATPPPIPFHYDPSPVAVAFATRAPFLPRSDYDSSSSRGPPSA